LRGILGAGERIKLLPDKSGRFLWADYSLGLTALLPNAEIMVAGGRFELYNTFPIRVPAVPASIVATR
jgi:hypothetical protein